MIDPVVFVQHRYNPILGEIYRCRFEYKDGSSGFYVAEQGQSLSLCIPEPNPT